MDAAKLDGVWWPEQSIVAGASLSVAVYPDTGTVTVPVTLTNPGSAALSLSLTLTGDSHLSLPSGSLTVPASGSLPANLSVNTAGLTPGGTYEADLVYSHAQAGEMGSVHVTVTVPTAQELGAADACTQAQTALAASDLPPAQATALQAHVAKCAGSGVKIDIKPGDNSNVINTKSHGKLPVAILGAADFDPVKTVNTSTLRFGRTGSERSLEFCEKKGQDVNRDGYKDLLCHFEVSDTRLRRGDVLAILRGQFRAGGSFEASDAVRILK